MSATIVRLIGHYVEMVVAMAVGMGVLALPWMLMWPGLHNHRVLDVLVMVVNMTLGMAAWMAIRRHSRRTIIEMSVAMVAPFVVLLVPLATGAISVNTLTTAGHILMFGSMFAAMLVRRRDYDHPRSVVQLRNRPADRVEEVVAL